MIFRANLDILRDSLEKYQPLRPTRELSFAASKFKHLLTQQVLISTTAQSERTKLHIDWIRHEYFGDINSSLRMLVEGLLHYPFILDLSFYFCRCKLSDAGLNHLPQLFYASTLFWLSLDLSYTNITDTGVRSLVQGLPKTLLKLNLNLRGTNISDISINSLSEILVSLPFLSTVEFYFYSNDALSNEACSRLTEALSCHKRLQKLNLDFETCTNVGDQTLISLLKVQSPLIELDLCFGGSGITDYSLAVSYTHLTLPTIYSV
eukprot:TRINITY_DN10445_c0_g1_i1.p1 TRINITY_DN10445_c0_g1~~TRINITY_DN10445_c0_g1_i1.p1  ORF type:complete len:263 (-),score=10.93 TRINITY_DN10445_c0_g1_i1:34-822(-)